jgi:hypothetical protein
MKTARTREGYTQGAPKFKAQTRVGKTPGHQDVKNHPRKSPLKTSFGAIFAGIKTLHISPCLAGKKHHLAALKKLLAFRAEVT